MEDTTLSLSHSSHCLCLRLSLLSHRVERKKRARECSTTNRANLAGDDGRVETKREPVRDTERGKKKRQDKVRVRIWRKRVGQDDWMYDNDQSFRGCVPGNGNTRGDEHGHKKGGGKPEIARSVSERIEK